MTFKGRAFDLINTARDGRGLPPLQYSTVLESIAQDADFPGCDGIVVKGRCVDMGTRNYFSHSIQNCGNKGVTHMLVAAGITHSGAAENIGFMNGTDDEMTRLSRPTTSTTSS
ncbi:MAG: CAP domain-containing protein [Acidimicrobiales bacterium]